MDYYYFPDSHWSRIVSLLIAEKGLTPKRHFVDIRRNATYEPAYMRLNPKGVVPTLVDRDRTICNSPQIAAYLDELAEPVVCAPDGSPDAARWAKTLEDFPVMHLSYRIWVLGRRGERSKEILDDKVARAGRYAEAHPELSELYLRKQRFFEEFRDGLLDEENVQRTEQSCRATLAEMANAVAEHEWLGGTTWSFADGIATSILYRLVDLPLLNEWHEDPAHPLRGYFERLCARPSYQAVFEDDPLKP